MVDVNGTNEGRTIHQAEQIVMDIMKSIALLNQNIVDLNTSIERLVATNNQCVGDVAFIADIVEAVGRSGSHTVGGVVRAIKDYLEEQDDGGDDEEGVVE